jgi:hypothetical protein
LAAKELQQEQKVADCAEGAEVPSERRKKLVYSKAKKEPRKSRGIPTTTVTEREPPDRRPVPEDAPGPWLFELQQPTSAALACGIGETVEASRSRNGIAITQEVRGTLGLAPPQMSLEMKAALRRWRHLVGRIVTVSGSGTGPLVEIRVAEGER